MSRFNVKSVVALGIAGSAVMAGFVGATGTASAAGGITITPSTATTLPGGPLVKLVITTSAPVEVDFEGTGSGTFGWSMYGQCEWGESTRKTTCAPGPDGKVVIPVGTEEGQEGQKVTFIAKAVKGDAKATAELTYGKPVVQADLRVENPASFKYLNPGGEFGDDFAIMYWDGHNKRADATVTVTGVKGFKFTKAPEDCRLDGAGLVITCSRTGVKGGGPSWLTGFKGTISGNEQILETRITGPLPDSEPEDNVQRTVYSYRVDPAVPNTKPTEVKPTGKPATTPPTLTKPTKRPELAETGADDINTMVIGGAAAALVVVGAGGIVLARKRRGTHQA
ncbi:LAETG motif-containing sortase-dependent surface protein [Embleya sp. NPDC059237]|uniref:LAETG motif-containing sortase-dependent surface protein n=1 Tax=Embleya sp. NPDC059237 TaxID=3346784 RepID=UPI00367CF325